MNKREISEIKKQFKKDNNAISRIRGCYVDADKQIRTTLKEAFFALSEEEIFKYYELFRKTLSGSLGKNLHNLEYSIHDEGEGSCFSLLMKLRDDKLADDETVDSFYNKVIENYDYGENYYIILIHSSYDIPGRAADRTELFDASNEVYNHILCCICPVKLSDPGLSYNETTNVIEERPRDWWVQPPMTGFLFPAFNDRSTDLHSLLYFSKNPEELHYEFIDACLGTAPPISFQSQKEAFQNILTDTLGEECDYGIVRQIHENLAELSEEHKEDMEPLSLSCPEVKGLLEKSGVEPGRLERFDQVYGEAAGENTAILIPAITGSGKFAVKTPDVDIRVTPNRLDLVETRLIEGRQFLVIAVEDNVELNGIPVKLWEDKKEG
ncbi:MAG: DUF4317 domain-containing protein [Lachnospiraceae bacterium]|nr:DUF4317 domain-containing protein [Lachnospiraceae bacterium]